MKFGRLDVSRDRVREIAQLADVRGGMDVDTLGEVVVRGVRSGQVRRQATVHGRVDELGALREEQLANVVEGEARLLHRVRDGHGLEVTAMVDLPRFTVNERIVGG